MVNGVQPALMCSQAGATVRRGTRPATRHRRCEETVLGAAHRQRQWREESVDCWASPRLLQWGWEDEARVQEALPRSGEQRALATGAQVDLG